MNQCPENRPLTDPTVLERAAWIVEADREKEKTLKGKGKAKKTAVQEPDDEDQVRFYCHCRQVCSLFLYLLWHWFHAFGGSFYDGSCPQVFKITLKVAFKYPITSIFWKLSDR